MIEFVQNPIYGYWEVQPKPTVDELRTYYEEKYYQEDEATYTHSYSADEMRYFHNKIEQRFSVVAEMRGQVDSQTPSLLDVGCGEGMTMFYYKSCGWYIQGIDFSSHGIETHHPELLPHFRAGNIYDLLEELSQTDQKFDLICLDNVLEHVIDPVAMLDRLIPMLRPHGVLLIEVPNDFSVYQQSLTETGKVSREYWKAYPDHLQYFGVDSLRKLCSDRGLSKHRIMADFPIEWFLANEESNYVEKKNVGKQAHEARIFIENLLHNQASVEDIVHMYEAMLRVGVGRQITGFFQQ